MWGLCFTCWCLCTSSLGKPLLPPPPPHLLLVSKSANTSLHLHQLFVVPQDPNCTVVFMVSESSSSDPLPWSLLRGRVLHATDPLPGSTITIPSPVVCAILRKHTWKACLSPKSLSDWSFSTTLTLACTWRNPSTSAFGLLDSYP